MKTESKSKRGRLSRAAGARFELKVRKNLEEDGWIVSKWMNNFSENKLVASKQKYRGPGIPMAIGTGFPDFIAFRNNGKSFDIIGVEVKRNGWLDKEEREKCRKYLKERIFSKILIARAVKDGKRVNIEYINFIEKYNKI
jgi:hypothetical protein